MPRHQRVEQPTIPAKHISLPTGEQATVRAYEPNIQDEGHKTLSLRSRTKRAVSYLRVALVEHVGDRQGLRERSRQAWAKREFHRLGAMRGDYPIATLNEARTTSSEGWGLSLIHI